MKKILLFLAIALLSFSSCVTKKKYIQSISDKTQLEAFYLDSIRFVQSELYTCNDTTTALRLNLAERNGENNILDKLRYELTTTIEELETEIENKSSSSVSSQNSSKKIIADKNKEIAALKAQLKSVETVIQKYQNRVLAFVGDVSMDFQGYDDKMLSISTKGDKGIMVLSANSLLFKRPNSTSLSERGKSVVQKISNTIKKYPDLEVLVVGHTDNRAPSKSYKDNWYFSTLRAVTVVREMTQNNDVNNNQISPVGKAEYSPVASNETSEGRASNQRIEIVIQPISKNMIRDILKKTK